MGEAPASVLRFIIIVPCSCTEMENIRSYDTRLVRDMYIARKMIIPAPRG